MEPQSHWPRYTEYVRGQLISYNRTAKQYRVEIRKVYEVPPATHDAKINVASGPYRNQVMWGTVICYAESHVPAFRDKQAAWLRRGALITLKVSSDAPITLGRHKGIRPKRAIAKDDTRHNKRKAARHAERRFRPGFRDPFFEL